MLNEQMKQFKSPGPDFRGAPFWAWNAKLEPEELIRQIRLMKEMGLGGFFMHARVGLNTEYLGKEWFECVRTCIAEAEKLGMNAWLYDEDRWPPGSVAGEVTRCHEESGTHSARPNIFSVVSPSRYPLRRPVTVRSIPTIFSSLFLIFL